MAQVHALRPEEANAQTEIRQTIDDFAAALRAKDLNKVVSFYAPQVVAYDMMPPLQYSGLPAWRQVWEKVLPMMKGEITAEVRDLTINVRQDLALCHGLQHFAMKGGGDDMDMWFRWTAAYQKINGRWLVIHEHNSVPGDMESGKCLMDLKP